MVRKEPKKREGQMEVSRTESRCFLDMTYGAGGTVGKRRRSCLVCRASIKINQPTMLIWF